ncbi:MAG: hypothetical protein M3R04_08050 [bacterium]|nr:hypothetical protein [bacterium]
MFNDAHWHIVINHLPVVGYLGALIIAVFGLFIKDRMLHLIAWAFTVASSITAVLTYLSGEPAENMLEDSTRISHAYLSAHERWGQWTYYAAIGVGIIALVGWIVTLRRRSGSRGWLTVLLLLLLAANGLGTITATTGGGISHPETHSDGLSELIKGIAMQPEIEGEMFNDTSADAGAEDDEHGSEADEDGRGQGRGGDSS